MMAEVGVHAENKIVAVVHRVAHAGKNRCAQAQFARAVIDVDSRIGRRQLVGKLTGAVR